MIKIPFNYGEVLGRVVVARPNGHLLKKRGYSSVDMHSHTHFSDGDSSVKLMVKMAQLRGVGISITDHNEIRGAMMASKYRKILTIPGIELNSKNGRDILMHFNTPKDLSIFYNKYVKDNKIPPYSIFDHSTLKWSEKELIDFGSDFGALITIPHPFGYPIRNNFPFYEKNNCFNKVHGIEVLNGSDIKERNRSSFLWAKSAGKAYLGGSDTHTKLGIGRAVTVTYHAPSIEEFLEQVKKRRSGVVGKELPFKGRFGSGMTLIKNLLFNKGKN